MTDTFNELQNQAVRALNTRDYSLLTRLSKNLLTRNPAHADAWFFLSIAASAGRQPGKALDFIQRALQLQSRNTEYLAQKASVLTILNRYDDAMACVETTASLTPDNPQVLDTLGVTCSRFDEHRKARELLAQAAALAPGHPQIHFNLGSAEQFLGHLEEARKCYERAISLAPAFARAHWALSELEKNAANPERLEQLEALFARPDLAPHDRLYLAHALSRQYEHGGRYEQVFDILREAKQASRHLLGYDFSRDAGIFSALREAFTAASSPPESTAGDNSLFIVGMPRSGTTLVEQILNAHSSIMTLGERQELPRAVKKLSGTTGSSVLDTSVIEGALRGDVTAIGRRYLDDLGSRVPAQKLFIDKTPLNFLYIGFIRQALPGARIICVDRHVADVCLSNYRQLFALGFSYYNYHYDLEDTARYIVGHHQLMQHWQNLYGDRLYRLSYENLTAEPESETRSLLAWLGLPWEAECLDFHRHGEAVATASTVQVRQPVYRSSVQRWRRYEQQLQPALDIFREAGMSL